MPRSRIRHVRKIAKNSSALSISGPQSHQLIGDLSNRSNYEYTDDDGRKTCRALQGEMVVGRAVRSGKEKQEDKRLINLE